jgi:DNA replication and repair protein RecF
MKITSIKLKNFRNYPDLSLDINNNTVVLSGPNAVGKTNLLESVYFASLFKSFRDDSDYIFMKGVNSSQVRVTVEKDGEDHTLEIFLEKRERIYANFKLDEVKKKRKEVQGFLSVVVFDPTDVDMFSHSPEVRRKYLNMVLSQKNSDQIDLLANYKKILTQKNQLLLALRQNPNGAGELKVWNEQLVSVGSQIILERKAYVAFLNQRLSEVYTAITGFHRPVDVIYETIAGEGGSKPESDPLSWS